MGLHITYRISLFTRKSITGLTQIQVDKVFVSVWVFIMFNPLCSSFNETTDVSNVEMNLWE